MPLPEHVEHRQRAAEDDDLSVARILERVDRVRVDADGSFAERRLPALLFVRRGGQIIVGRSFASQRPVTRFA
jgi:hypothetical protein